MIQNVSKWLLSYLLKNQIIEDTESEKEYYQYGIEITVSSLLNIVIILCLGIITRSISESIVFLVCFMLIRQFTGGFHADTYLKCNLTFGISYIAVFLLYHFTAKYFNTYFSLLITFVSVIIIWAKCPIENINKPIPERKKKFHKIMAALLGTVYGIIGTALTAFSNKYGCLILYTLSLVVVLVVAAIIKDRRCKNDGKEKFN